MHATIESRQAPRFSVHLAATIGDGVVETPASCIDVSRAGVALASDWTWRTGSRVTLRVRLADGRSAVARALIRRAADGVMGLSLTATGPSFAKLLAERVAN